MKRRTLKNYVNGTWIVDSVEEKEKKEKTSLSTSRPIISQKNKIIKKYDSSLIFLSAAVAILAALNVFLIGAICFSIIS